VGNLSKTPHASFCRNRSTLKICTKIFRCVLWPHSVERILLLRCVDTTRRRTPSVRSSGVMLLWSLRVVGLTPLRDKLQCSIALTLCLFYDHWILYLRVYAATRKGRSRRASLSTVSLYRKF